MLCKNRIVTRDGPGEDDYRKMVSLGGHYWMKWCGAELYSHYKYSRDEGLVQFEFEGVMVGL